MVGIIVVNYNTYDEVVQCVDSIYKYVRTEYKIYIVDNGSDKYIKNNLIKTFMNSIKVEIISLSENLGYSSGNNVGILKAVNDGAHYIAIINSDIILKNDIFHIMLRDIDKEVAVVGPKILTLTGKDGQQLMRTYCYLYAVLDRVPFYYIKRLFHLGTIKAKGNKPIKFDGMVSGCCFLVDAEVFKEIGFFDENVFLYSEERILSIKLKSIGKKVCYDPEALIVHMEGQTTKKSGNAFADFHRYVSDYYTVLRYCRVTKLQAVILCQLRKLNFLIKSKKNKTYLPYYNRLKIKYHEIENQNFKILR